MRNLLKALLQRIWLLLPKSIHKGIKRKELENLTDQWKKDGASIPPPHFVKQKALSDAQKIFNSFFILSTVRVIGGSVCYV